MKRFAAGILLSLLVCAAAGACAAGRIAPRTVEQDERKVLLAVIHWMETGDSDPNPILATMTLHDLGDSDLIPDADVLEQVEIRFPLDVFPDLIRRNERSVPLPPLIGAAARVRWITQAQLDSVSAVAGPGVQAGSPALERIYPGMQSINSLSRAGFDESRTHASVMYGCWCPGGLCGNAGVFLLERRSGRWRVIDRIPMAIS